MSMFLFPFFAHGQGHQGVQPMPADTITPLHLHGTAGKGGAYHLSGKGKKLSYMLLPYPMLTGGIEKNAKERKDRGLFHEAGGGGGFRLAYDSLLLLSFDAFLLAQTAPSYWERSLTQRGVTPSYGLRQGKRVERWSGQLQMRPSDHFTFRLGRGQHFFGNGHRSLFLSHNSDVHPYFRMDSEFGRFRYVNLFSKMEDLRGPSFNRKKESKYAAFHYLSFEPNDKWSIGLFESVLWQGKDSMNPRGFDPSYLNPVIFYRPVEYAQGSADRVMIGMDLAFRPFEELELYSQLVLDEFLLEEIQEGEGWWGNKYGIQAGVHWREAFGSPSWSWRVEFNTVRPYTYSHASPIQSYTHRGSPLAHPLGANFAEALSILKWEQKAWRVELKGLYSEYGTDPSRKESYGRDPFKPYQWRISDRGNRVGQGRARGLYFAELEGSYCFDEASGVRGGLTLRGRELRREERPNDRSLMASLFLRSELFPRYTDF